MISVDNASIHSVDSAAPPPISSGRQSARRRPNDTQNLEKSPTSANTLYAGTNPPALSGFSQYAPAPDVRRARSQAREDARQKYSKKGRPQSYSHSAPTFQTIASAPLPGAGDSLTSSPARSLPPLSPQTKEQGRTSRSSNMLLSPQFSFPSGQSGVGTLSASQIDITALPHISDAEDGGFAAYIHSKSTPRAQKASIYMTELYTISYLIFFAIFGTLARLGLQALTFYPSAPVIFSELWANVAGTFIMGFLTEDRRLFRVEWGNTGANLPEPSCWSSDAPPDVQVAKARHIKVKKTIPLYIGLATGFCGSFTSFSSFMRDVFLSLSNNLQSPVSHTYSSNISPPPVAAIMPRNDGYAVMAIFATIIITVASCYSALKVGAHLAMLTDPMIPSLSFRFIRRITDPLFVFLAWGTWLGAIIMAIIPPNEAWRGKALFACVFAPVGCLARYYISLPVNAIVPTFPLGTFTVNIFGTVVLGMAYDLQHISLHSALAMSGSVISCQILQGIMDGFCGALTTVSTWILELETLERRHAYSYGSVSVASGFGLLLIVMGSVRWTVGWQTIICAT